MAQVTFKEGEAEADGFTIRYTEAGETGSAGTVVVLDSPSSEGWGQSKLHLALAQQYRVVVLELPGFGSSPVNTGSQSIKDLANTMAQAAAMVAPDGYTLIGTSFGAHVAIWQALQVPDKVEALVLISPTAILPTDGPTTITLEQMAEQLLAHPEIASGLPPLDPDIVAKERALVQRLNGSTHDAEAESKLGEIQCATLVVFGLDDKMVSPKAAGIYRERIPNSNIAIVYDAGHVIVAERPEALINLVSDDVERRETFIVGRRTGIINP